MGFSPSPFPLQEHLGMVVASPEVGVGTATLEVTPQLHNPNGVVHGAVLFAMVDTAMGAATMSTLDEGLACASIEVHLRFIRPCAGGRLDAQARVIKPGRRITQLEATVVGPEGTVIATGSGSFAVI